MAHGLGVDAGNGRSSELGLEVVWNVLLQKCCHELLPSLYYLLHVLPVLAYSAGEK